jgi:hypothetical protein
LEGINATALAETLRDDKQVDDIFALFRKFPKSVGAAYIEPIFNRTNYDVNTAPIYFNDQPVIVRIGMYIESLSNFATSTMVRGSASCITLQVFLFYRIMIWTSI